MTVQIGAKRASQLDLVDDLPAELRAVVHELGHPIVMVCLKYSIRSPRQIYDIVREIWNGPRQGGQRTDVVEGTLDWLLMSSGSNVSAATLRRILWENNYFIVTGEPTKAMLEASMSEVSGFNVRCSREEKHRRRLRAAISASWKGRT